jgi:hypothetical protein
MRVFLKIKNEKYFVLFRNCQKMCEYRFEQKGVLVGQESSDFFWLEVFDGVPAGNKELVHAIA